MLRLQARGRHRQRLVHAQEVRDVAVRGERLAVVCPFQDPQPLHQQCRVGIRVRHHEVSRQQELVHYAAFRVFSPGPA